MIGFGNLCWWLSQYDGDDDDDDDGDEDDVDRNNVPIERRDLRQSICQLVWGQKY